MAEFDTIRSAGRALRAGRLFARELVAFCGERIERMEGHVRAWVRVDLEAARREADRLDDELRRGIDRGPLHGIPIGVKDLVDVAGWPTEAGSPLRRGMIARHDAPLVARLRAGGAILLGKTVTTEFACFDPSPTRNPLNEHRTPGGSSSGSAAAVASGMCLAAIGTQTGGSILRPASFCGVAGFKPTHGRVSLGGVVPISGHLDHAGPIARRVADLEAVFGVLDERRGGSAGLGAEPSVEEPLDDGESGPLFRQPRWVAFREYSRSAATADVDQGFAATLERLRASGAVVAECELPAEFAAVHRHHRVLMARDAARVHEADFTRQPEAFGPQVASLIREGLEIAAMETQRGDYALALEHQREFRAAMHRLLDHDTVALMPSTVSVAPGVETTGDPRFNSPWSFAGIPAVTIPGGVGEGGMPCGLQLLGQSDSDYRLLRAAAWCERRLEVTP
jgi:aspartyl-tRNA(Asn)/glutamyl-tRNA(Gln) amidotransferase subunit A